MTDTKQGPGKIAVFFPGVGYNPYMPLLYYARKTLMKLGYECRAVTYTLPAGLSMRGRPDRAGEVFDALFPQAKACLEDVDWSRFDDIIFVSKSIGTAIAAAYASGLMERAQRPPRHILYTPLAITFKFSPGDAMAFLGTNDPYSRPEEVLGPAEEQGIPVHVYDGADHSLETGDLSRDIETLREVMEKTAGFADPVSSKHSDTGRLWGKTDEGSVRIDPADILYLESVDDRVFVYTRETVARIDRTLSSFVTETDDESFFRCSKSMVINVNRVKTLKSLSSNRIDATMESGEHIIISRRYAAEFRRLLRGDR